MYIAPKFNNKAMIKSKKQDPNKRVKLTFKLNYDKYISLVKKKTQAMEVSGEKITMEDFIETKIVLNQL